MSDKILTEYKPVLGLIVYKTEEEDYYIESHAINERGQLMEGKPLEQKTIQGMVDVFYDENKSRQTITGIYPDNLLKFKQLPAGEYEMIWYRPEEKRYLHMAPSLKIKSGLAWVPPLIYRAKGQTLSVYAIRDKVRPTEKSKLYRAPFYNISNSDVCLGSGKLKEPEKTYASIMKYWEDFFWLTEFSHISGSNPIKGNLNIFWPEMMNTQKKWANVKVLIQHKGLTLNSIL